MRREVVLQTIIDYMNRQGRGNFDGYIEAIQTGELRTNEALRIVDKILTVWKMEAIHKREKEKLEEINKMQARLFITYD